MDEYIRLGESEAPPGRSFAHPDRTAGDLASIGEMAATLRRLLAGPTPLPARPRPLIQEVGQGDHRVIICDDGALRAAVDPAFVGFFADKRLAMDHAPLTAADDELVREFPRHPGILSYSSIALADGNWGNLIVLRSVDAAERWREGERHERAARELAPRHYTVVRLHNGVIPGGLLSGGAPVLLRTRYFDYQGPSPWRAERALSEARGGA
jgi:hypothetical protein